MQSSCTILPPRVSVILQDEYNKVYFEGKKQFLLALGGKIEPDENIYNTVKRELFEEVGLGLTDLNKITYLYKKEFENRHCFYFFVKFSSKNTKLLFAKDISVVSKNIYSLNYIPGSMFYPYFLKNIILQQTQIISFSELII